MTIHYPALGALFLGALATAAGADEKKQAGATYATPQAVFDAAQAAQKKQDYATFVGCFAPPAQKEMAIGLAFTALAQQAMARADEKLRTQFKPILDVLNKHGLTDEVGKKVKLNPADPKEAQKVHDELAGLIKDPAGLAADLMTAYSKTEPFNRKPPEAPPTPQLLDVKIDGDKARGTMAIKVGERELRSPAEFVKVGGSWKLAPPQPAPAPKPAGGPGR